MRNRSLLIALLLCSAAHAQNWALLNPAYRYNYSNDGTDTISNQIRVMDVDTLGVDSFRYELNLIGVVCDTCPAIPNEPCDTCFVLINQPQFLGYRCIQTNGEWLFLGSDTMLIKSEVGIGSSWTFLASAGITATVDTVWPAVVFGSADSLRRVLLSNGDTVVMSRDFGIVRFAHGSDRLDLIGVEGAAVGRTFPDIMHFFDFQPGDQLIYKITRTCSVGTQFPYPGTCSNAHQITITGRTDYPDSVVYTTSVAEGDFPGSTIGNGSAFATTWAMPTDTWSFGRSTTVSDHPILGAYPGEVIDTSICEYSWVSGIQYLTRHGITADGRNVMYAPGLSTNGFSSYYYGFYLSGQSPDLCPISTFDRVSVRYEERLGLVEVRCDHPPSGVGVKLVGAIIGGDTIIPPPIINWTVGMNEPEGRAFGVYPNPASDHMTLHGMSGSATVTIRDLGGRLVRSTRISAANEAIPVNDIAPGLYVIAVDGFAPQRLMVAR